MAESYISEVPEGYVTKYFWIIYTLDRLIIPLVKNSPYFKGEVLRPFFKIIFAT